MIKAKTITTDKSTVLVVEIPEGAYYPNICQLPPIIGVNYFLYENGVNTPYKEPLDIPKGNWQLLGRMPDTTEDQAGKIVDEDNDYGITLYQNYTTTSMRYFDEQISAIESLYSLLQANEVCFENRELKWKTFDTEEKYKQAQSKVWDKERCYIFIKVD